MRMEEERYRIQGRQILLRCPQEDDAQMMIDYLTTVSGETRFLRCEPDEIHYTLEQERDFIRSCNDSPTNLLLQAFVDGQYAGNASFSASGPSRRNAHRVEIGIALFQQFTGMGIGTLLMQRLIAKAGKAGFRQCELTVVSTNEGARALYRKLGFREWGRIPNANRYADGTSSDDILMVLDLEQKKE